MSVPSTAPAPPLLSTTIVWPSTLAAPCAAARSIRSFAPPGPNGTTKWIGRLGHASSAAAAAAETTTSAEAQPILKRQETFMLSSGGAPGKRRTGEADEGL